MHVVWTDLCGVQRGKILRRDELVPAWKIGRFLPISALVLDVTGQDVPETGLVFDEGDRDMLLWPVPGSLVRIPWSAEPAAQYIASVDLDGTPHFADPRNALAPIVEASRTNRHAAGRRRRSRILPDGPRLRVRRNAARPITGHRRAPQHYQAYYLQDLDDFAPFFKDLYAYAEIQGLPAKTLISEYAPGQMEIVLRHRTDVLKACDEAIMLKRLIKAAAEKHGMVATFMAKPYAQWTGSGMHIHVSLADAEGNNLFAADDPDANELLLHAVGA